MSKLGFMFRLLCTFADKKRDRNLKAAEDVQALKNIPYADGGKYNLLDIYYPKNAKGALPVIVSVHGGGYVYGMKEVYFHYGTFLAQQGFTVVNFNYHLAPSHKFPTQLREINLVMEWIEKHASQYHMDPEHVFLVGDSAGAQMTSHYCTIYSNPEFEALYDFQTPKQVKIQGVALNCGMYDITEQAEEGNAGPMSMSDLMDDYLGKDRAGLQEQLRVLDHITENFPPAFVMTSQYDFLKDKAEPMHQLLKERGVKSEYRLYGEEGQKYMGHVFHVNMNLEEAKQCNLDEIHFFKNCMECQW